MTPIRLCILLSSIKSLETTKKHVPQQSADMSQVGVAPFSLFSQFFVNIFDISKKKYSVLMYLENFCE